MSTERLPSRERLTRGFDRSIYIRCIGMGNVGDLLAGCRIGGRKVFAARGLAPLTTNVVAELALVPVEPRRRLFGIFGRWAVLHAVKFFDDSVAHARSPYAIG